MKKALSLLLSMLILFTLAACGEASNPAANNADADSSDTAAGRADELEIVDNEAEAYNDAADADTVGFYTDKVDHFARDPYKICFMKTGNSVMTGNFGDAIALWGKRLNYELTTYNCNGDIDAYINTMEVYSNQGIDGYVLDISSDYQDRVFEVATELEFNWIPGMTPFRGADKKLIHPDVVFDTNAIGRDMAEWLVTDAFEKWDDISEENAGFIVVSFSAIYEFTDECNGANSWLKENGYDQLAGDHFFIADCINGNVNTETAYNNVAPIISANTDIKYWLICATCDDFGEGSARAAETLQKGDFTSVICDGGETLFAEWDTGYTGAWTAACYVAQIMYTEGKCCGLVAMIDGRATPETLWQDNVEEGGKYGFVRVPTVMLTKDNYTEYCEWVDHYTGTNTFNYEWHGTSFEQK